MTCSVASSADYRLILALDIPLIIVYQSIPLIWIRALYAHRERLNPPVNDPAYAHELRAKDKGIAHLGFLTNDYKVGAF